MVKLPKRVPKSRPESQAQRASVASLLVRIWGHLSPRRRWQLPGLAILMLFSGVADALSLGTILPFLSVLVDPDQIFDIPWVAHLATGIGITTADHLVLPLTLAFALAALASGAMRLVVMWCIKNYTQHVIHDLSVEVYRRTLYQPYQVHVGMNTSEVISAIEKVTTMGAVWNYALSLSSAVVTVVAIGITLVAIEPGVALMAFFSFGSLYGLVIYLTRRRLSRNSHLVSRNLTLKVKTLQEGLGGIRDVLLDQGQPFYCDLYRQADWPLRRAKAESAFMGQSPRYIMESLGMVLIAFLAYGLSRQPAAGTNPLTLLGTLALGAQRLLPALQQLFSAWAFLRGNQREAEDILRLLDQPLPPELLRPSPEPLPWQSAIEFVNVSFRYRDQTPWVLHNVSFTIPKGYRVGVVGTTGSGKSTTLDILMGLLNPTAGQVLVDGMPLQGEYGRAWQKTIAHVPQHIYLADTTIAENIALGVPKQDIDLDRVRRAARQARIADFIEQGPEGYWAPLGERGIRLSGGQRQRVGIARALYKQASLLVFDEATSALDNATEQAVMDALSDLADDLTIVMIAHRLSTVEHCDLIIELAQGQVVAQGTYRELLDGSVSFQRMAGSRG